MKKAVLLITLSTIAYGVEPLQAQNRPADANRIERKIRELDAESVMKARTWALDRSLPVRIRQRNGDHVELVDVQDGRPIYLAAANRRASSLTNTQSLYPGQRLGLSLTGEDMVIGIWDGGSAMAGHRELSGRVTLEDASQVDNHATHVAGTLAASGVDDRARGMAYRSRLKSYSWTNDATEMSNEGLEGLLISNHSYSIIAGWHYGDLEDDGDQWYWLGDRSISTTEDYMFGRYDQRAAQFDRVAYTNPLLLPVVAAGNERVDTGPRSGSYRALDSGGRYQTFDVSTRPIPRDGGDDGFDSLSGHSLAKNVLTVGSVGLTTTGTAVRISGFSSFGPTDDGRIKPDLVGLGESVYSLSSAGPDSYAYSSGTSMATPNVAGSLILLQEHYRNLHGGHMLATALKALVIHTAQDLDLPGPDYRTGWGLLDAETAADVISQSTANPAALMESKLFDGETFSYNVRKDSPGLVRVTMTWTDHASVQLSLRGSSSLDDPTPHLRNDLDLRLVHDATGTVYKPYAPDPTRPREAAATGDNFVDTVEQVFLARADTGSYTIVVSAKKALYLGLAQPFALVVSGMRDDTLPVRVGRFEAEVTLDGTSLEWQTLFERVPGTFVVERAPVTYRMQSQREEGEFIPVGELTASADPGGPATYRMIDPWSVAGRYVYRIVHESDGQQYVAARIEVNLSAPDSYAVLSNYPNPFAGQTTVVVDLPKTQRVSVTVHDALGRQVTELLQGELQAGRHRLPVDASGWAPGVYFVRIHTPNGAQSHKIVLNP